MNKKRLYIALWIIVCLVIWFFAWQEYTKYQLRKVITDAFSDFWNVINNETDNSSNKTIKNKKEKKKEPIIDTSITINEWATETISSKYRSEDIEAEITFNDISFVDEIRPPEPQQEFYSYYPAEEGKSYVVVSLKVKNLWSTYFNTNYVINNQLTLADTWKKQLCSPKIIFWWKYEYSTDIVAKIEKDSKWKYSFDDYFSTDPLEINDIIVAFSIPNEVKDKDADLNICFWDKKINLQFDNVESAEENTTEETTEE